MQIGTESLRLNWGNEEYEFLVYLTQYRSSLYKKPETKGDNENKTN